jgi:two-component system cell cycle response regulator DivK
MSASPENDGRPSRCKSSISASSRQPEEKRIANGPSRSPPIDIEGFEITVAADGAEAISSVTADSPDIILMDLNVPIIDGWEATRRLKADPKTSGIPVNALSAHAMAGDRERALAAGCDDFDTKPIDFDRLLSKVKRFVSHGNA